ncbi:MAG: UDP-N-acetylmuramate dehydrogenase [Rickettsiales bacterium]
MAQPAAQSSKYDLPTVRGSYRFDVPLAPTNWFRVGGNADVLFKPADAQDLADFLRAVPASVPVTVIGVGSNLIIRDGGLEGVVIRLGRGFTDITIEGDVLVAGAAALDVNVARFAADHGRAGLEFYAGIPGTIGGALAMNAGAYEGETKDVLIKAEAVDRAGNIHTLSVEDCNYTYRHFGGPKDLIFTRAWFKTLAGDSAAIHTRITEITTKREATQPVRERTGGSTFKNPEGHKAWQLVDGAGCRGLTIDGAQMSPMHCNFMINTGNATAAALENLGDEVRKRVKETSGVELEWEIKRIGRV